MEKDREEVERKFQGALALLHTAGYAVRGNADYFANKDFQSHLGEVLKICEEKLETVFGELVTP